MPTCSENKSILIVTGMHRSGTSFTASLLQNAGLDIGRRLIEPGNGNIKGFFENVDFVKFHENVLRSHGLDDVGWTVEDYISIEEPYIEQAQKIIAQNCQSSIWGWKDPRTTLFLDFWAEQLPDAKFLFIYRSPWEVVDSLYRRGDEIFTQQPTFAIKIWMHYNQKLLQFLSKFPERCLLVSVYNIAQQTEQFIHQINTNFNLTLTNPTDKIYDRSLFYAQTSDGHRPTLIAHHFPQAINIYQELNRREIFWGEAPDLSWLEQIKATFTQEYAFQDWVELRHLEKKVKSLRSELRKRLRVVQ